MYFYKCVQKQTQWFEEESFKIYENKLGAFTISKFNLNVCTPGGVYKHYFISAVDWK